MCNVRPRPRRKLSPGMLSALMLAMLAHGMAGCASPCPQLPAATVSPPAGLWSDPPDPLTLPFDRLATPDELLDNVKENARRWGEARDQVRGWQQWAAGRGLKP